MTKLPKCDLDLNLPQRWQPSGELLVQPMDPSSKEFQSLRVLLVWVNL